MSLTREQSGVYIASRDSSLSVKERILNERRLRALPQNAHIIRPLQNPERLPR